MHPSRCAADATPYEQIKLPCSSAEIDRQPVLKALICRDAEVHSRLPADIDSAIATFLGGELRTFYVPCGMALSDSLRAAVLAMYRSPVRLPHWQTLACVHGLHGKKALVWHGKAWHLP